MSKKVLSVIMAISLIVVAVGSYPMQNVYAAEKINPDDLLAILDDITLAGEAWESVGFDSEDIAEIMQMEKKDASYYEEYAEQIAALSIETEQTRSLENELLNQGYAMPYAQDGNPPESPQEQSERIRYVTQVALNRYGSKYGTQDFSKYVLYLYMSHYIDNPYYSKNSPSFDSIYAYVITADDIRAYENFINQSKFAMFSSNLVNLVDEFKTATSDIYELRDSARKGKMVSINTATALYELSGFVPDSDPDTESLQEEMGKRAYLITASFKDHYESTSSVRELLDAIYLDLEPEDVSQQYIDTSVLGFIGLMAGTTTVFGLGLSVSLCYFNLYMNIYDRARLVALHYSLSGRIAVRADELIWG